MATHPIILAWKIPMDRGAWWVTVYGVTESDTTEQLSTVKMYKCSLFSTSLPTCVVCVLFDNSHSDRC